MSIGKKSHIIFLFFFIIHSTIFAVQKGSDSAISIEPYFVFPSADSDNQLLTFGYFKDGFGLEDNSTSCTFGSIFSVSGQLSLHGGNIYLAKDLIFQNPASLATSGMFFGQQHVLDFSQSITGIPGLHTTRFDNTALFLNSDVTISGTVHFTGNCLIDGRWNGLMLDADANLIIGHDSSLELRNLEISKISGYKIRCLDDSGTLLLDNVQWGQEDNYTFTMGSILFSNAINVIGENSFRYASALTSTISINSMLHFAENSIFSIGRKTGFNGQEPLAFIDGTSVLELENCTFNVTSSGMRLSKGIISIVGQVSLDLNGTTSRGGLYLGDGTTVENDIKFELSPGTVVSLERGHFINDNATFVNFLSANINKTFIRKSANTFFYLNHPLVLSNINLLGAVNGQTILGPSAQLYFDNCFLNTPAGDFYVTGTRLSVVQHLLPGNGSVKITQGSYPFALSVKSTGNTLLGLGDMAGAITLQDGGTQLVIQTTGAINANISSAGSTLVLGRDLRLSKDVAITGSATVSLATNNLTLQMQDKVWTSTIVWSASGGTLNLTSNLPLTSQMTFNGDCTIQGNGNTLNMLSGGNIIVAPNSRLRFKNITITGMSGSNIACSSNSSRVVFDKVHALLRGDYNFAAGSILFSNVVQFEGSHVLSYTSNITSTIDQNTLLSFDQDMTFSYDPVNQRQDLLHFISESSSLFFDANAHLYVGIGGLSLVTGQATFNNYVSIIMGENSLGLTIGDNISNDDFVVNVLASTIVDVMNGSLVYQNVDSASLTMATVNSVIRMEPGTELSLNQSMPLGRGRLQLSSGTTLNFAPGTTVIGSTEFFKY